MTPALYVLLGLAVALICAIIEARPSESGVFIAVVRILKWVGLIVFGVGFFYYVK